MKNHIFDPNTKLIDLMKADQLTEGEIGELMEKAEVEDLHQFIRDHKLTDNVVSSLKKALVDEVEAVKDRKYAEEVERNREAVRTQNQRVPLTTVR